MSASNKLRINSKNIITIASALTILLLCLYRIPISTVTVIASRTWTVDDDGPADYHEIQQAIDAASEGDTILVFSGIYHEHVVVNKMLSLFGENKNVTIMDGDDAGTAFKVSANNVTISGFTIQNGDKGVHILSSMSNNDITDNIILYNEVGVLLDSNCIGNIISHNKIMFSTTDGIYGDRCGKNVVAHNNVSFNGWHGIFLYASEPCVVDSNFILSNGIDGVFIRYSSNNTITGNLLSGNHAGGLYIYSDEDPTRPSGLSKGNIIENNIVLNNSYGIKVVHSGTDLGFAGNEVCGNYIAYNNNSLNISGSSGNSIYHNNFIDNSNGVSIYESSNNTWDGGYLAGGNYWIDHNSTDLYWGPYQNITGSDGIGDILYRVSMNLTQDRYPYMHENGWLVFPKINIFSPSNSTYRSNIVPLLFDMNKPLWVSYSLDEQPNVTIAEDLALTDLSVGVHSITFYANDAFGNKVSSKTYFTITFLGDLSLDGTVNIIDITIVAYSFGARYGSERWNPDADLNGDAVINIRDITTVAMEFGKRI